MPVVNSATILPVLNAVATLSWPGTHVLPTNVHVREEYALLQADTWPAMNVVDGAQKRQPASFANWIGGVQVIVRLYDDWAQNNITYEAIWARLDADVECVMANISSNPSLVVANVPMSTSVQHLTADGYEGKIIKTTLGRELIVREVTFSVGLLPYDVP